MRAHFYRVIGIVVAAACLAAFPFGTAAAPIRAGSDVSGAPFEYFAPGGHQMLGFDIDLMKALSAKLARPVLVVNHNFDDLLAAVRRGSFDMAMSAISDTRDREKLVDFVDYFIAGGGLMVPGGNPHRIFSTDALCGYSVTVESGTSYLASLQKTSDGCKAVGLAPIGIQSFTTDDQAYAAFVAGKADAYVADYPVAVYRARFQNGGKAYDVVGKQFDVVPYGIAFAKGNPALRDAVRQALIAVIADGTYDAALKKWDLERGALRSAPINAGTLFQK